MGKDVAVLDVGSSKLIFAMGCRSSVGTCVISSFSCVPYAGYYESEFCNLDGLLDDVKKAFNSCNIKKVPKCLYIGVPAEFSKIETATTLVNFGKDRLISNSIINSIHTRGDQYSMDKEWELFSSAAVGYILDDERHFINPVGERAKTVKATISYMYVKKIFVDLFDIIAENLGFKKTKYISSTWAVSSRYIEENARSYGALSLDIGFATTSLALVKGDGIINQFSAPLGTLSIYDKLSKQLKVNFEDTLSIEKSINLDYVLAEDALYTLFTEGKVKTFKAVDVNRAIMARLDEIVYFINSAIDLEPGVVSDNTPIYLTGGGVYGIKGALVYLEKKLKRRVRGRAPGLTGYDKPYFTSLFALLDVAYEINESQSFWNKIF